MAIIEVNFISKCLMRVVTFNAIIPVDKFGPQAENAEQKPLKTLYLLHGIFGNYTDWVNGTRIQAWAEANDLAVIMPSGENRFYLDDEKSGELYGEFIGKELVEFTRKLFPLSDKREDTFIAGLSMGGYGAIRNGLKYAENFGCVIGLSAALAARRTASSPQTAISAISSTKTVLTSRMWRVPASTTGYSGIRTSKRCSTGCRLIEQVRASTAET